VACWTASARIEVFVGGATQDATPLGSCQSDPQSRQARRHSARANQARSLVTRAQILCGTMAHAMPYKHPVRACSLGATRYANSRRARTLRGPATRFTPASHSRATFGLNLDELSQKHKGGSIVRSAQTKRHIVPIAHAARVCECELGCFAPFRVHGCLLLKETINNESSSLYATSSSIPLPMWDNFHYFPLCFCSFHNSEYPTPSIDISFILAPFWTWFGSLESSHNIEHKPRENKIY
jgi:hypothetical protein